jgi:hypothetical protein
LYSVVGRLVGGDRPTVERCGHAAENAGGPVGDDLRPMATRRSDLEDHIATLEKFESLYGAYLVERRGGDHDWSGEERARRERELKELAPQAEAAMVAAGATRWDEGPVRIDLPHRILRFVDLGDGEDDEEQWRILNELPTHIGALKGKLRHADDGHGEADERSRRGERWVEETNRRGHEIEARPAKEAEGAAHGWVWRLWHEPNPWVIGFVVTVVGGIIVAVILAA